MEDHFVVQDLTQQTCKTLTDGLVAFLREIRPQAAVSVYNNETEAQSLARIAAADVAICGPSTFCIWPSFAANTSYITKREGFSPDRWPAEAKRGINVVSLEQNVLSPVEMLRHMEMFSPERGAILTNGVLEYLRAH
jgi:hypothetical protein